MRISDWSSDVCSSDLVANRHDEAVKRLRDWIALPSIAAEGLNSREGAETMARLAREAGFQQDDILPTDGKTGVFATLDAGAAKTVGLYLMYDVKQFDPSEWRSPPLQAHLRSEERNVGQDGVRKCCFRWEVDK